MSGLATESMKEHHLGVAINIKKARLFQLKADDSLAKESSAFIWNENPNARAWLYSVSTNTFIISLELYPLKAKCIQYD